MTPGEFYLEQTGIKFSDAGGRLFAKEGRHAKQVICRSLRVFYCGDHFVVYCGSRQVTIPVASLKSKPARIAALIDSIGGMVERRPSKLILVAYLRSHIGDDGAAGLAQFTEVERAEDAARNQFFDRIRQELFDMGARPIQDEPTALPDEPTAPEPEPIQVLPQIPHVLIPSPRPTREATMTDESKLIERAQQGNNAAKTELLLRHHGFILSRVRRQCRNPQDMGDYISVGQMGMLKGIERFDPSLGIRLITYAGNWIDHALRRYRETDSLVKPPYNRGSRIKRREALGDYDGSKLDDRRSKYDTQFASAVDSLNVAYCDDGEDMIYSIPSDTPTPESIIADRQDVDLLKQRLCGMPEREVATLLRGDKSLKQIGERHGVCRERIRQVEAKALTKMRSVYGMSGHA